MHSDLVHPDFTVLLADLPATLVLADTAGAAAWARSEDAVFGKDSVLTAQEQNYAREFAAEAGLTWAAGRVVTRHVLASVFDHAPADVAIRLDSAGKPRIDDGEFSVTRARRLVLVAVAEDPVGVDLEAVPDHSVAVEAKALLHPRERGELEELDDEALAAAFVRVWARKEAFLKALSTGLARDPGMDYIGSGAVPASPHPDVDIHDVTAGIPADYLAAIAFNR